MKYLKYVFVAVLAYLAAYSLVLAFYSSYSRVPDGEIFEGDSVIFTTDAYSCLLSNGEQNMTICRADGTECGEQIDNCNIFGASWPLAQIGSYGFFVYDIGASAQADSFDVLPK